MKSLLRIRFYLLILFLLSLGQGKLYGQAFNFQELSIQQGLPQSQAYAIIFDSTQHAWIGTQGGGLCRYDGFEFDYFTKNDSLISNRIYSLRQVGDEIWSGQFGGVSVFDLNANFKRNYYLERPASLVQDIVSYEGQTYLATDAGVYHANGKELIKYEENVTIQTINVFSFFESSDGLWCCTPEGLLHFTNPTRKITRAKGLSASQVNCAIEFGSYWVIGTYGGGVDVYSPIEGVLKDFPFQEMQDMIILELFVTDVELWIGTLNNGVYVYSTADGSLKNFRTSNGLTNDHVRTITSDHWDNIWIGTSGGGVSIFQNSPFVEYNTSSGLNGNYVYSVINTRRNDIWLGTEGMGAVRINDTSAVTFDEEYGFYPEKVKAIFEDANGDIWLGTEGKGLGIFSQYDGKDTIYTYISTRNGMISDWIKCFAQNKSNKGGGPIYIGTTSGVMRLNRTYEFPINQTFSRVNPKNGKFPERINSLDFINDQMWFTGSDGSYGYYANNKIVQNKSAKSALRNCVGTYNVRWLGSSDNGILKLTLEGDSLNEEDWISVENGLSSNNIYQLLLDGNNLWVGTEKGLDKVPLDSNFNVIRSDIEHFGYEEGFEGVETNINASHRDVNGNLWFGTVDGLYLFQGGQVNYEQRKPPILSLNDFSIFYESIDSTEYAEYFVDGKMVKDLLLPYDMNHIGFSFKAIHYTYAKNIKYRWKLTGADREWTPPTKITTATYSNLQPGKYKFEVQSSIDDNWDEAPTIEIKFAIDKPYYEKLWFKALYWGAIGIVLLLIALVIYLRIRRKNRAIREKFEMEKNLVELEQKALRLQMNPHFIFNVLTSIHNLIILNDPDKARYALSKFSKLMRRVLENSREKFITVDDEVETLENYVQLEKLTSNLDVELEVEIDDNVDPHESILPPLMMQPFVENAIIHGLKDLDHPGRIKVGFKLVNEHLLECYVEDNGKGREKAAQINAQRENYHKSTALKVTQERLASLNKEVDFVPFEILDLKEDDGSAKGTRVVFRLAI